MSYFSSPDPALCNEKTQFYVFGRQFDTDLTGKDLELPLQFWNNVILYVFKKFSPV